MFEIRRGDLLCDERRGSKEAIFLNDEDRGRFLKKLVLG